MQGNNRLPFSDFKGIHPAASHMHADPHRPSDFVVRYSVLQGLPPSHRFL